MNEEADFESNVNLVHFVLKRRGRVRTALYDYDDLFQVGCIGLLKAIRQFDPMRGCAFATYAVPLIQGELRNFLNRLNQPLKEPRRLRETYNLICALQMCDEDPETISVRIGKPVEHIRQAVELATLQILSMDSPINRKQDRSRTMKESIPTEADFSSADVDEFLGTLSSVERQAVLLRLRGVTQAETGRILGVTQTSISRFIKRAGQKYLAQMRGEVACAAE